MENLSYKQRLFEFIKRADTVELLCLVAIAMTSQADRMSGCSPMPPATKGAYKRAIKRLRKTQANHPEKADTYEDAIRFIRREWLCKEAA